MQDETTSSETIEAPNVPDARAQLVVTYNDNQIMYYQVGSDLSWRIDSVSRCVVIGKMPRLYIPLDQVRNFVVEAV